MTAHELPRGRLLSLDVLRGATIAGMILVNNAGDWSKTFPPLLHAEWHGWTPTDLVFPFFLFVMGVAIPLALGKRIETANGDLAPLYRQILRRTALLFGLGLLLNWFPLFGIDWSTARIPGVLQRIALVYLCASVAFVHLGRRSRAGVTLALLGGYWLAMKLIPVPGHGAGDLSPEGNLASWIDAVVLGQHTWASAPGPGDPEGLLSTIPAIATALLGVFTGELLRSSRRPPRKLSSMLAAGVVGTLGGWGLAGWLPINKNLWTSTYAVFTAGLALLLFAGIYWLVDMRGYHRWAWPFTVFGMNSIAAYVGSGLLARLLHLIRVSDSDGGMVPLGRWLYQGWVERLFPDYWASLAWAVAHVLVWLAIMGWLYRRRIFIKI